MCSNKCVGTVELDYVVLKLNGNDITSLSSYEAVQMFLQAKETLVVELCRKQLSIGPTINDNDSVGNIESNPTSGGAITPKNVDSSQIVLTLRAFDAKKVDVVEQHLNVATKETQTFENFVDLNRKNLNCSTDDNNSDLAQTIADHFIEREHHLFEQCLEPEIDIEEVTLAKRDSGHDKTLGLSVCCNNPGLDNNKDSDENLKPVICNENTNAEDPDDDACEDVFISDIQTESIADRDGRLRRGDQILRINGIDIKSKKHAEIQLAEKSMEITLLVSRLLYPENDDDEDDDDEIEDDDDEDDIDSNFEYANGFLTDDYTNVVDKLDKVLLTQQQESMKQHPESVIKLIAEPKIAMPIGLKPNTGKKPRNLNHFTTKPETAMKQKFNVKTQIATSSKTKHFDYDESEHIYETIPEDSESEPLYCSPYQSSNYMTAMGSCSSPMMAGDSDILEMQQQTQRVAQWLGIKSSQMITPRTVQTLAANRPKKQQQQNRTPNRVYTLRSAITTNTTSGSSSDGGAGGINYLDGSEIKCEISQHEEVENSSSAYNTGGSNNSASPRQIAVNLENKNGVQPSLTKESHLTCPISNNMLMLPFVKTARIPIPNSIQPFGLADSTIMNQANSIDETGFISAAKNDSKLMRSKLTIEEQQCPQFNAPNLSRYHFVSSQEVAKKANLPVPKTNSILVTTQNITEEIPMVWKVKRRPDGSRYIVKRPVRNSSVVNVAIRKGIRNNYINTTTEDDTISEVKIGRYWTKEERKRHIERARERRHQQQQQLQQQLHPQQ